MGKRIDQDGGIRGIFPRLLLPNLAKTDRLGDIIQVRNDEPLMAPPRGALWHQPAWAAGLYQLTDLVHHPIFQVGDRFGIHPDDPIPLPPRGMRLMRMANPESPDGTTAHIFKVVLPPAAAQVLALPKPTLPTLQAAKHFDIPREPNRRWQVLGVDGRNLNRQLGAMVATA